MEKNKQCTIFKLLIASLIVLFFVGCHDNSKKTKSFDGKKLLEQKCASCHNLDMPPKISDDELAPPMMSVSFHVHNFVKPSTEDQRTSKAKEFVIDYVLDPSLEKSFCDKNSLKKYGLMPSQRNNVSKEELKAISEYMFNHFTQEKLTKIQMQQEVFNAYSDGKKVALKYKCLTCHKIDIKIVGPALKDVSLRYKDSKNTIKESIQNGSKTKWENSRGAIMPAFKNISNEELEVLTEWIIEGKYK